MPMPGNPAVSAASGAVLSPPPSAAPAPTAFQSQERNDPLYREFLEWRAGRSKASTNR